MTDQTFTSIVEAEEQNRKALEKAAQDLKSRIEEEKTKLDDELAKFEGELRAKHTEECRKIKTEALTKARDDIEHANTQRKKDMKDAEGNSSQALDFLTESFENYL